MSVRTYVVLFQSQSGKIRFDTFPGFTETEARRAFWACYRHDNYKILATIELTN